MKSRNRSPIIPRQTGGRVVATVHKHGGKQLSFGVNFARPELQFGWLNRTIFSRNANWFIQSAMLRNQNGCQQFLGACYGTFDVRVFVKKNSARSRIN